MLFVLVQTAACTDSDRSSLLQVSCLLMVDVISSSSPPSCSNTNSTELPLTTCSTIQELKALVLVKTSGKRHFAGLHSFFSKSFSTSVCTKKKKTSLYCKSFYFLWDTGLCHVSLPHTSQPTQQMQSGPHSPV